MTEGRFVAGFGKTNVDLLYFGMSRIPGEGEEIYSEGFSMQLGGGIPATLINLGRLGVPGRIQTLLGDDVFSRFARGEFKASGIIPDNLYKGSRMPVNLTSAIITDRDRAFVSYSDEIPFSEAMREAVLAQSRGAAIVLMHEDFPDVYRELGQEGPVLVYDTGWREDMSLDTMHEVLTLADWYTPNDKEAMKLTGAASVGSAARRLAPYFDTVVIKLGAEGCLLYKDDQETLVPPLPDVTAIDSTGAGDAFLAGFTYGLYHGAAPKLCALYGNITGGTSVQAVGCLAAYVDEKTLLGEASKLIKRGWLG